MKVNSTQIQQAARPASGAKGESKAGPDEIKAKIRSKFGVDLDEKKEKKTEDKADTVVSINKKGEKKVQEEGFGDIKNNDPASDVTQEKLRSILKTGAFHFNDKERAALNQILN